MEQATLEHLGYASPIEGLGEKFHASPKLLHRLNPRVDFSTAGGTIQVPNVHQENVHQEPSAPHAASVVVSKSRLTVQALDDARNVIADYPATVGSVHDPLPIGKWKVVHVTWNPVFYYNPDLFWDAPSADTKATIQPGPNNPVGVVWIGLTKEHYGIHGTPEPSLIGHVQSHGCIRLTNWDAAELAGMVGPGTAVIFEE
jgi:lipoprotein-anchoring transpeptidase ErfK/SrfK